VDSAHTHPHKTRRNTLKMDAFFGTMKADGTGVDAPDSALTVTQ
jgi:hypothetical protein